MNIKQALEYGIKLLKKNEIEEPILKTRIVLANVLNNSKEYLIAHETEEINNDLSKLFRENIEKLCNNFPLQYITNKQEFMGLEFYVDKNVLIPQPDTEILVEEVIEISKEFSNLKILDLCTGSGAIGITIAKHTKNCDITLSDISAKALEVAEQNCIKLVWMDAVCRMQNKIKIIQSDLFNSLDKNNKFDVIVSNPPYIKTDIIKTLDKEVQNEPILALDGGVEGLDIYRRIINDAYKFLKEDGYLCLEIGYDQKAEVTSLISKSKKYKNIYSKKDLTGNDRIIVCRKEN